jgi:hypothetical protein
VLESTNNGVNVQSNGGGTVGNRLVDVTVSKTGAAGAAAVVVSGNAHQLSIQNLTTMENQLAAVYVNGTASSIDVDGWTSVDDGLNGGALSGQGVVAGTSSLSIKGARLSSSKPIRGMPVYFEALSAGSELLLDGVTLTQIGGAGAANQVAIDNSDAAGAIVRMRNVTTIGPLLGGVWAAGAPSLTYVLEDVDLSSATYPFNIAPGALANFGTFTANGSTEVATKGAFSARATISISLASEGSVPCDGIPTFSSPTIDGTFYTTASTPDCNSTYNWRASE